MIAFVMRTVDRALGKVQRHEPDREWQNYLGTTLHNLAAGGLFTTQRRWTLDVIDSGSSPFYLPSRGMLEFGRYEPEGVVRYHVSEERLTANQAALKALTIGVERKADWIVFLEDDIDVCSRFVESVEDWLADHAKPEHNLYAFCAAYQGVREAKNQALGAWLYPIAKFYGTQAVAFRHEDAEKAVVYLSRERQFTEQFGGFDLALKRWALYCWRYHTHFLASAPSFVQHIGRESSLHLGRFHDYVSWPGPAWSYTRKGR